MTRRLPPGKLSGLRNGDLMRTRRILTLLDHIAAAFVAFVVLGVLVLL